MNNIVESKKAQSFLLSGGFLKHCMWICPRRSLQWQNAAGETAAVCAHHLSQSVLMLQGDLFVQEVPDSFFIELRGERAAEWEGCCVATERVAMNDDEMYISHLEKSYC